MKLSQILFWIYCGIQVFKLFSWKEIIDLFTENIPRWGLSLWDIIYIIFFLPAISVIYIIAGLLCILFLFLEFWDNIKDYIINKLRSVKILKF